MLEKLAICQDIFHGFDYSDFMDGTATERLAILPRRSVRSSRVRSLPVE
jgi:hypothetical protein